MTFLRFSKERKRLEAWSYSLRLSTIFAAAALNCWEYKRISVFKASKRFWRSSNSTRASSINPASCFAFCSLVPVSTIYLRFSSSSVRRASKPAISLNFFMSWSCKSLISRSNVEICLLLSESFVSFIWISVENIVVFVSMSNSAFFADSISAWILSISCTNTEISISSKRFFFSR